MIFFVTFHFYNLTTLTIFRTYVQYYIVFKMIIKIFILTYGLIGRLIS